MSWISAGSLYEGSEFDEYGQLSLPFFVMETLNASPNPLLSTDIAQVLEDEFGCFWR